jgi:hypothetical protein
MCQYDMTLLHDTLLCYAINVIVLMECLVVGIGGVRFDRYEAKKRMEAGASGSGAAPTPSTSSFTDSSASKDREGVITTLKSDLINVSKALERKVSPSIFALT